MNGIYQYGHLHVSNGGKGGGGVLSYILDRSVLPRVLKKPWPCRSMRQTKTDSMSLRAPKPGK